MAWLRRLIDISSSVGSSIKYRNLNPSSPCLFTSLSHFSTESTLQIPSPNDYQYSGLGPTKPGEKPRVVVLGTGWAGCRLMKDIDTSTYDVICVSPQNHMVFTPLLVSTCFGTLEFRSVAEPIGRIQPAISREPGSFFFLAHCKGLDTDNHVVTRMRRADMVADD